MYHYTPMEEQLIFTEKQWFARQWWFYSIFVLAIIGTLVVVSLSTTGVSRNALLFGAGIPEILLFIFISSFHLTTRVFPEKIMVSFFPFTFFNKEIFWQSVKSAMIISVNPVKEFGGVGVRYRGWFGLSMNANNMGFIVSGNRGLQLELSDGKKIFIGTKKEAELEKILKDKGFSK